MTPDPAQRRTSLQSGECLIADPAPADIAALKADPNLAVDQQEALDIGYLAFNTLEKPFDDPRVRQGAQHGDRQAGDRRCGAAGERACGHWPVAADRVVA